MPQPAVTFRAFLFDLDGTLIDHFSSIHRTYAHTLQRMGLPEPTPRQVRAAIGGGIENSLSKFVTTEQLAEALAIYRDYWDRTMLDGVALMPGARELLTGLHQRGAVLGVITNKLGMSSRLICEHLGIASLLKAVVGAKDTPWLKPEPEFTRHVLAAMESTPEEALLVGDSPYDVDAAHAGGFPAWCVITGTHSRAELAAAGADVVFNDLSVLGVALGIK